MSLDIFSDPQNVQHQRVNAIVNYGLWMKICHCRFMNSKRYTMLVGNVDNAKGSACMGIGKSLYISLNFFYKTAFKKFFKKYF
jgi:hypothetical protein